MWRQVFRVDEGVIFGVSALLGPSQPLLACCCWREEGGPHPTGSAVLAVCVVSPDERSPSQRGEVGRNKTSGSTAYPAAKAKRDRSMPLKREQSEDV